MTPHGAAVIDADRIGHQVLELPEVLTSLVKRWGPRVLRADGSPNRREIGGIVFPDPAERRALEAVVFPHIRQRVTEAIATAQANPEVRFIVLDAAVMLEAGWNSVCDRIVYVDAPRDVRLTRLAARSGWNPNEVAAREASQMPPDKKLARADVVLMNDGSPDQLQTDVNALLNRWGLVPTGSA